MVILVRMRIPIHGYIQISTAFNPKTAELIAMIIYMYVYLKIKVLGR